MNTQSFLLNEVYPIVWLIITIAFLVFAAALILRLIFNFTDPNPFGTIGRFSFKLKKLTDKYVYPAARLLANFKINTRYAPLVTMLVAGVLVYFALGIIKNTFFIVDNLSESIKSGNVKAFVGFVIYGLLSVLILFIFIRFLSSWFVFTRNTFLGFVQKVTDPILLPAQRLIPPIGMFDISAMLVLILIGFLQTIVLRIFVYS
jgi:YggT family protein